jgi:hypothetical protein
LQAADRQPRLKTEIITNIVMVTGRITNMAMAAGMVTETEKPEDVVRAADTATETEKPEDMVRAAGMVTDMEMPVNSTATNRNGMDAVMTKCLKGGMICTA